jgi:hypothetical protein
VVGSPPETSPLITPPLAIIWPSVTVDVDSFTISPWTVPLTGPERSGRPPTLMLPETSVPVCARVMLIGTDTPPVPALPVHVPATLAVGAFAAAC